VYVNQFFDELAREVRRIAALPHRVKENEIGFFDKRGIESGDKFDDRLAKALQSSRVLVCLYSRAYFRSDYCGKEFSFFQARIEQYMAASATKNERPRVILPVLWDREERVAKWLPSSIHEIQYKHADYGDIYAKEGLLNLMRQQRYKADYAEFIDQFAGKLVAVTEEWKLPQLDPSPKMKTVTSAWSVKTAAPNSEACEPTHHGTDVAHFVFVAGRKSDLVKIKQKVDCYGSEGGRDWLPFYPHEPKTVGWISQTLALAADVEYVPLPISESLLQNLRHAEATNTIVIVVVDPWSIHLETYRKKLDAYDQENFNVNSAILVLWNQADSETKDNDEKLRCLVEQSFFRTSISNTNFRNSIGSIEEFRLAITSAIFDVRNRINRKAKLFRTVGATPLPRISGPGGDVI
jgi:FxsC-like protein